MPIVNRMAELHKEITEWRRQIHANPELQYDVHETAALVTEKLKSFFFQQLKTLSPIELSSPQLGHVVLRLVQILNFWRVQTFVFQH